MPKAIDRFIGLTAATLTRSITWSLAQRTGEFVMPGSYGVIAWLTQMPDSTQSELSRLIGVEQPTMASTLSRMERDGLIERQPDPDHRRKSRVRLTSRGRDVSILVREAAQGLEEVCYEGISQEEIDQFFQIAERIIENLAPERRKHEKIADD